MLLRIVLIGTGVLGVSPTAQVPSLLGRCPVGNVVSMTPCRLTDTSSQELLVSRQIGEVELHVFGSAERVRVPLQEPTVIAFRNGTPSVIWQAEPGLGKQACRLGLVPDVWVCADINHDRIDELLRVTADSCHILSLATGSARQEAASLQGARTVDAACCDINNDGVTELVTLELPPESSFTPRLLRVWQIGQPELLPCFQTVPCLLPDTGLEVSLLGAARLEDYDGILPIVAGVFSSIRPSHYATIFASNDESLAFTANPFPWAQWFRKQQILPAGELTFFNVGDTLVAWGFFVPGSRPGGPSRSFAALQDGEWRLLQLRKEASRISGLVCRFRLKGTDGWLELRDNLFYFYPQDPFIWR